MGKKSRDKGVKGEREVGKLLRAKYKCGDDYFQRRAPGQEGPPDLVRCYLNWPFRMIEIRRRVTFEKMDLPAWWAEIVKRAERTHERPILVYRVDGDKDWFCIIRNDDWNNLRLWKTCKVYLDAKWEPIGGMMLPLRHLLEGLRNKNYDE